uniref:Plastid lipid-associated protein/fibrillin conserved domain-containing protein n=1 Tax=Helicotheca tamesis TaxID=374047 RepID=A0A7S2IFS8_9STRA|mmetsp:Transcript_9039/g.12516  ORF Transcript_9039/g.12516 Transcript_9039/m.12516 type:complete len:214 (-) Transcript_9039:141-782(-)|eukprot:CAMPEP_0185731592 /NCGR_PEP_ID=MMETSP1171-20130828/13449_1 /TAXON_ID=374046 /ORGANISM="Helicotheca tamensis, Strain CCMP826" /LENGTH=213 /DNA_ID=CAMNT_0028400895 /DNA_START=82 /DNA_END=723 /DNA_ORIENTATION=-
MRTAFLFATVTAICACSSEAFLPAIQRPTLKAQLRTACKQKDEQKIFKLADDLSKLNPTTDIIKDFRKLDGNWKLDFTTAPTGEVPDEATSGVKTFQTIDTSQGMIYNVIDQGLPEKGLKIGIGAEATRKSRVAIDFQTIEAFNNRFPRKVTLKFPPRSLVKALAKARAFVSGKQFDELEFKEIAHFDVLFLDNDLRIQRNSEGNLFVNSRVA